MMKYLDNPEVTKPTIVDGGRQEKLAITKMAMVDC